MAYKDYAPSTSQAAPSWAKEAGATANALGIRQNSAKIDSTISLVSVLAGVTELCGALRLVLSEAGEVNALLLGQSPEAETAGVNENYSGVVYTLDERLNYLRKNLDVLSSEIKRTKYAVQG